MAKSGTLTIPNAGNNVEQQNSHALLVLMQNSISTLEDSWQGHTKLYIHLLHNPEITLLYIYPKIVENLHRHKTAHGCL